LTQIGDIDNRIIGWIIRNTDSLNRVTPPVALCLKRRTMAAYCTYSWTLQRGCHRTKPENVSPAQCCETDRLRNNTGVTFSSWEEDVAKLCCLFLLNGNRISEQR